MGIAEENDPYGVAMILQASGVEGSDKVKKAVRIPAEGEAVYPLVTNAYEEGVRQFVHTGWGAAGEYTMLYYMESGKVIKATINIVSLEFDATP